LAVDKFTIESVLGFDLNVDITDMNGKPLSKGVKVSAIPTVFTEKITTRIVDKSFFTHFNEDLLNKIRQHRRLTD
jgi:type II secretory ATPase GspE/PulE/Tfp pilus assembly ATPase PilB-like protein